MSLEKRDLIRDHMSCARLFEAATAEATRLKKHQTASPSLTLTGQLAALARFSHAQSEAGVHIRQRLREIGVSDEERGRLSHDLEHKDRVEAELHGMPPKYESHVIETAETWAASTGPPRSWRSRRSATMEF